MEWSGRQQIYFLLQSVVLGAGQGLLLDVLTGMVRITNRKRWLWTDVIFGPIAAVITFCGALVIMDGHLHPLLFVGVGIGMLAEHVTIGVLVCRCIRFVRGQIRCGIGWSKRLFLSTGQFVASRWWTVRKKPKNPEKP